MNEEEYSTLWERQTGAVKWFSRRKGYGFIEPDEGDEDIFFHSSSVDQAAFDELSEGQEVEFDAEPDPKQPDRSRAAHVRLAG